MTPTERLQELLFAEGFIEASIRPNLGYWSHRHQDVCRWEGDAVRLSDRKRVSFLAWSTVTECARRGITVSLPDDGGTVEVYAKPPRRKASVSDRRG